MSALHISTSIGAMCWRVSFWPQPPGLARIARDAHGPVGLCRQAVDKDVRVGRCERLSKIRPRAEDGRCDRSQPCSTSVDKLPRVSPNHMRPCTKRSPIGPPRPGSLSLSATSGAVHTRPTASPDKPHEHLSRPADNLACWLAVAIQSQPQII